MQILHEPRGDSFELRASIFDLIVKQGQRTLPPMPRLHSRKSLISLRFAAAFFLLQRLLILFFIGTLGFGALTIRPELVNFGLMAGYLWIGLRLAQFLMFTPCRCPLCLGAIFARSRCLPHRRASRLLGSHRLATSLAILAVGRFKCPYCATSLSMGDSGRRPVNEESGAEVPRFRTLAGSGRPGILRKESSRRTSRETSRVSRRS